MDQVLAPTADSELLLLLAEAAEELPSSGDKANFLIASASEYLTPASPSLRACRRGRSLGQPPG